MKLNINIFKIETNHVLPKKGRILVAEPFLSGSYFNRSVILLVAYSDKGAIGFILNKKVEYQIQEIVPDFPDFDAEVYIGGPVSTDSIYFIHSLGNQISGSIPIKENLYWGGDFEELKSKIRLGAVQPGDVRFFMGYSGWDSGQLEEELQENSWLVSEIEEENVMGVEQRKQFWLENVRAIGGKYLIWENFPENPSLN